MSDGGVEVSRNDGKLVHMLSDVPMDPDAKDYYESRNGTTASDRFVELNHQQRHSESNSLSNSKKETMCQLSVPLLKLKALLFLWFGAGTSTVAFLPICLQQKGITATKMSLILTLAPMLQIFIQGLTGIITDKTGKYKPVIYTIFAVNVFAFNFIISVDPSGSDFPPEQWQCEKYFTKLQKEISNDTSIFYSLQPTHKKCSILCSKNSTTQMVDVSCPGRTHLPSIMSIEVSHCEYLNSCQVCIRKTTAAEDMEIQCEVTVGQNATQRYGKEVPLIDIKCHTFNKLLLLVFLTILYYATESSLYRCFDVVSIHTVRVLNTDFGLQRIWTTLGEMAIPLAAGYAMNYKRQVFNPCETLFYLINFCLILLLLILWRTDVRVSSPGEQMWSKMIFMLQDVDVMAFVIILCISGMNVCFTFLFVNYFLYDLGADGRVIGLRHTVSNLGGLPIILASSWLINKFGSNNIFLFALFCQFLQSMAYSSLMNPWWCLMYEVLSAFSYHILGIAVVKHAHKIAPDGLKASAVIASGGMQFTIGKIAASSIGGSIMSKYGARVAFRFMAFSSLIACVFYFVFLKRRDRFAKNRFKRLIL